MEAKMKIHISNLGLPEFFDRKSDIIYGLFHALSSLGHCVTVGHNSVEGKRLNIIIGSDIIAGDHTVTQSLTRNGCDYVVYEVENFNGKTINYRRDFNLENYELLLRNAKLVITPYRYHLRALRNLCGVETPVEYARWGFHPKMVNPNIDRNRKFNHDALFFGLVKGTRFEKCDQLNSRFGNRVKLIDEKLPFTIRDYYMSSCKFGLSLSYGETDNFVNPFRIMSMVANGMPVLADHERDEDNYLDICENYEFEELLNAIESHNVCSVGLQEKCSLLDLVDNLRGIYDFKNDTAVIYLYSDEHARSQQNFENFATNSFGKNIDFIAGSKVELSKNRDKLDKFKEIYFDNGEHDHQKISSFYRDIIQKSDYQNVVVVSSKMSGPYSSQGRVQDWVQRFTSKLNKQTHLVGSNIVMMPRIIL